jgi:hypothetical protein
VNVQRFMITDEPLHVRQYCALAAEESARASRPRLPSRG